MGWIEAYGWVIRCRVFSFMMFVPYVCDSNAPSVMVIYSLIRGNVTSSGIHHPVNRLSPFCIQHKPKLLENP